MENRVDHLIKRAQQSLSRYNSLVKEYEGKFRGNIFNTRLLTLKKKLESDEKTLRELYVCEYVKWEIIFSFKTKSLDSITSSMRHIYLPSNLKENDVRNLFIFKLPENFILIDIESCCKTDLYVGTTGVLL